MAPSKGVGGVLEGMGGGRVVVVAEIVVVGAEGIEGRGDFGRWWGGGAEGGDWRRRRERSRERNE